MDNYACYKLTDWGWIGHYKKLMGDESFREYVNNVYRELLSMKVGGVLFLESTVREENRELFVKIVCMFIQEGNCDYDFSHDFKQIRRHEKATMVRKPRKLSPGESGEAHN